jgi:hypothetical protein
MTNHHLNSRHLGSSFRDDFRRVRQALLELRALHGLGREQGGGPTDDKSYAMAPSRHEHPPTGAAFLLMDQEGTYPLKPGMNMLGRIPDNDVVIPGHCVSRRHCAILVDAGGGCELYDVASRNGTYVNGLRVNGLTRLVPGDEIWICCRRLMFLSTDANRGPLVPRLDQPT